eukprot:TRINITY_DN25631_c0_g1_i1.p1 TRINITY_DN25631_c0_g1~~TRINITY_DN25631_c0_g1_i1.p1  ORF type:complete len:318 (+),score=104.22 TRINITY_DN25631_c0_g1_i1:77-1030(+)
MMYGGYAGMEGRRLSRPTSPCATTPRRGGARSPAVSERATRRPLGAVNLSDKDRYAMMMEGRKREVDRESEFKLRKRDIGCAERQMRGEMRLELSRQQELLQQQQHLAHSVYAPQSLPHYGAYGENEVYAYPSMHTTPSANGSMMNTSGIRFGQAPPDMTNNRYQKLYEDPAHVMEGYPSVGASGYGPTRSERAWGQEKKMHPLTEDEKSVVKRCIRCVLESAYINNAGEFKQRLGFYRGDLKRVYEALCKDGSDWGHHDVTSHAYVVVNNCMHEVIDNNICTEWGRWFGNVSRRRLDNLYIKLEGCGRMLPRGHGF